MLILIPLVLPRPKERPKQNARSVLNSSYVIGWQHNIFRLLFTCMGPGAGVNGESFQARAGQQALGAFHVVRLPRRRGFLSGCALLEEGGGAHSEESDPRGQVDGRLRRPLVHHPVRIVECVGDEGRRTGAQGEHLTFIRRRLCGHVAWARGEGTRREGAWREGRDVGRWDGCVLRSLGAAERGERKA